MKIIELKFKNLNSLYGEWSIDFNSPEYSSNGIFALTGPTGSGKSTVLDAICLAMYGRTPRLGAVTAGSNEIMSRQTGECFSEVVFESQEGRYRCSWEQHRAHRKAEGKLTDPKHEISDAYTGKIIENKKSLVGTVVEQKTGMDYERFTRSILLAQGGFDTFLNAETGQKSRILEQITGTDIYSEISVKVHERRKEENDKLKLLKGIYSEIKVLSEEELNNLEKVHDKKTEEKQNISVKIDDAGKKLEKLKKIHNLEKEIESFKEKYRKLELEKEDFKDDRIKLDKALKASVFDGDYASLKGRRELYEENKRDLKENIDKLPFAEQFLEKSSSNFSEYENEFEKLNKEKKELSSVLVKVRLFDQEISGFRKRIESINTETERIKKNINEKEKENKDHIKRLNEINEKINSAEEYIINNSDDGDLEKYLTGIEEKINSAVINRNETGKKYKYRKDILEKTALLNNNYKSAKENLKNKSSVSEEIEKHLQDCRKKIEIILGGRNIKEYRIEKEYLLKQKNLVEIIINLENEREKLEDGKPCPLCGSVEHPYASGNIPEKKEVDNKIDIIENILKKAEDTEERILKYEKEKAEALKECSESEKIIAVLSTEIKSAEKELENISESIKEKEQYFDKIIKELSTVLEKYNINDFKIEKAETVTDLLKKRLEKWKKQNTEKDILVKEENEIKNQKEKKEAEIKTFTEYLSERNKESENIVTEMEKIITERNDLFGDKNADEEEIRSDKLLKEAENNLKNKRNIYNEALLKLNNLKTIIDNLEKKTAEEKPVLDIMEKDFTEKIKEAGFDNEIAFYKSKLNPAERIILSEKAKYLDEKETAIKGSLKDREKQLESSASELTDNVKLEEVQKEYDEFKEQEKLLIDETALIRHKLKENEASSERLREKQDEIEKQSAECSKWEKLHSYIGSADGKKYREFAQGITFEIMISHANRQITKMTDRYILLRSSESPLELNVADNYQAGEIRSVKNLSGGESFIVSLALALGLSKMAGKKVRVDSLFLDEGFGTLDEDALETALETLSSLQQDGKLIGVISHVPALKERITTQISVNPVSGGRSSITGPGCRASV